MTIHFLNNLLKLSVVLEQVQLHPYKQINTVYAILNVKYAMKTCLVIRCELKVVVQRTVGNINDYSQHVL